MSVATQLGLSDPNQDLLAQARQATGRVSYASLGNGHASQVAVERLAEQIGATLHHVPFRDGAQLLTASTTASGSSPLTCSTGASIILTTSVQ